MPRTVSGAITFPPMRLRFGAFLAPHHPVGEHPMLMYRRDLDLVEQLDRLGFAEFWCRVHRPSGMQLAGKYGIGVLSIGSNSREGLRALPTQWSFAEDAAAQHGSTIDRADWRVLMSWHLAESREQAVAEAAHGLHLWHNEYNVRVLGRPDA